MKGWVHTKQLLDINFVSCKFSYRAENARISQPEHSRPLRFFFVFFLKKIFFYLLAVLGLRCCSRAFSSCREQVYSSLRVHGLLIAVPSLVAEHGLYSPGSVVVAHRLSCSVAFGIFPDQGSNRVPCIGRWILNPCTNREALGHLVLFCHWHTVSLLSRGHKRHCIWYNKTLSYSFERLDLLSFLHFPRYTH